MPLFTNNPFHNTVIVFSVIMILLYITKPNIIYDKEKKEFRQFGTSDGKTLLSLPVLGISLAIILYIFFNYISHENEQLNGHYSVELQNHHNTQYQIQELGKLQNQMQQLMQQYLNNQMNQQLQNQLISKYH